MQPLRIGSSARGHSVTRPLTAAFRDAWLEQYPGAAVVERDLAATPLPHIATVVLGFFRNAFSLAAGTTIDG
jgi:FMN-dependent NADH-azoreductase